MTQLAEAEAIVVEPDDHEVALALESSRVGEVSPTRLMLRRFTRSRLAVISGIILVLMYLAAVFAPFLSPNDPTLVSANDKFAKPSSPAWDGGPGICRITQVINTVTISTSYTTDCSHPIPIHFFGRGFDYKLFGLVPTDRHLMTVDQGKLLIFGADSQGRDIFSQMIFGAWVSMTIGVLGVIIATILGGVLLQDGSTIDVLEQYPWVLTPALAVILCITCFQLLGDGIRDAFDPYS
jgi:peptide/nickel transport system permease protein